MCMHFDRPIVENWTFRRMFQCRLGPGVSEGERDPRSMRELKPRAQLARDEATGGEHHGSEMVLPE